MLGASKVIAIEPNPIAYRILLVNATINNVSDRLAHHAVGLSDAAGRASVHRPTTLYNLGATILENDANGAFELVRGDDLLKNQRVDFVKIDTEGMELEVLRGLAATLARDRPVLFVEVDNANAAEFEELLSAQRFRIAGRSRRYPNNENVLALPI